MTLAECKDDAESQQFLDETETAQTLAFIGAVKEWVTEMKLPPINDSTGSWIDMAFHVGFCSGVTCAGSAELPTREVFLEYLRLNTNILLTSQ